MLHQLVPILCSFVVLVIVAQRIERWRSYRRHVRMLKAELQHELRMRAFWA